MDRISELIRQLEPETAPPDPEVQARQRAALVRSGAELAARSATGRGARRGRRRGPLGHPGRWAAAAGVAAAGVLAALVVGGAGGPSSPETPASPATPAAGRPGGDAPAVLTALTRALQGTGGDVEETQSTVAVAGLTHTAWTDLGSGACRMDTSAGGKLVLRLFVEGGRAVFVDYANHQWWTESTGGLTCAPLTPQAIERAVSTGHDTIGGQGVVGGHRALELVSTSTGGSPPVAKTTILWVDASTYLPIQETTTGHASEQTTFTWMAPSAATAALFRVQVPAGFTQVGPPAHQTRPAP